nr:PREDICTED: formin-like protein 13 isoform X2 [Rhinolophus sinicus]
MAATVGKSLQLTSPHPAAGSLWPRRAGVRVKSAPPRSSRVTAPRRAAVPARPISPPRDSRQLAFLSNHLRSVASNPHPAPPRRGLPPPTHLRILCLAERPHTPTPPAPPSGHHSSGHARQFRAMTTAIKRRLPYCQGGEIRPLLAAPRSIRLSPSAQTANPPRGVAERALPRLSPAHTRDTVAHTDNPHGLGLQAAGAV